MWDERDGVVPAFPRGDEATHQLFRDSSRVANQRLPRMCVTESNQPSAVKTDEDPDADAHTKYNYRNPMIIIQP